MIPVGGPNVHTDFGSDQLRTAGAQKWKSVSTTHGSELCLTGQLDKGVTRPADSPSGSWTWCCRPHADVNPQPLQQEALFRPAGHSAAETAGAIE